MFPEFHEFDKNYDATVAFKTIFQSNRQLLYQIERNKIIIHMFGKTLIEYCKISNINKLFSIKVYLILQYNAIQYTVTGVRQQKLFRTIAIVVLQK